MSSSLYALRSYWDARFEDGVIGRSTAKGIANNEWLLGWEQVQPLIQQYCNKDGPVLVLGCGLSLLPEAMAQAGYQHVTAVDYSGPCIRRMREREAARQAGPHGHGPAVEYQQMDVTQLALPAGSASSVLDKATLDCLMNCDPPPACSQAPRAGSGCTPGSADDSEEETEEESELLVAQAQRLPCARQLPGASASQGHGAGDSLLPGSGPDQALAAHAAGLVCPHCNSPITAWPDGACSAGDLNLGSASAKRKESASDMGAASKHATPGAFQQAGCGTSAAERMLQEACRVCQPGAVFMCISYAGPRDRLPLLLPSRVCAGCEQPCGLMPWQLVAYHTVPKGVTRVHVYVLRLPSQP